MSFRGMETSMQDGVFYQIVSSGLKTVCEDEFWEQKDTIAVKQPVIWTVLLWMQRRGIYPRVQGDTG